MVTHLQQDVLECDVKLALGIITTNEADRILAELFQILRHDAVK